VQLIFSFDSEDWLTPEAADAEKWWAEELHARGIRASFQCVGEMIRALKRRGRQDVIQAIAKHEIGYHTNYHSLPPSHPEALEARSLSEGISWVLRREAEGIQTLLETFGRVPISYCPPGDSWTPATLLAMGSLGIRVFCDGPFRLTPGRPLWYCGMLTMCYDISFDRFFGEDDREEERFKAQFNALAGEIGDEGVMVVYSHPTRLVTARFWDLPFRGGRTPPIEECPPAPLWPADHVRRLKDRCRRLLDWIQAREGIQFTDYAATYARFSKDRRTLVELLDECGLKPGQEGQLPLRDAGMDAYVPASVFDEIRYNWAIYREGFTGRALLDQGRRLVWTSAPVNSP